MTCMPNLPEHTGSASSAHRRRCRRLGWLLAGAALLAACGGERVAPALCSAARPPARRGRPARPEEWYRFLIDRDLDGGAADCAGGPVRWREPTGCLEPSEPSVALPVARFSENDLILTRVDEDTRLVWVITQRFGDGTAIGPVALVREGATLEVLAIGTLKARPRRARLRLQTLGESTFLSAEGEACTDDDDAATCRRTLVLLVERQRRFHPIGLVGTRGQCVGPARFDLARREELLLETGWRRRFDLVATLQFQGDQVLVQEQVSVSEYDPQRPGVPARPLRRVDGQRFVRLVDGRLQVNDVSLWQRVMQTALEH